MSQVPLTYSALYHDRHSMVFLSLDQNEDSVFPSELHCKALFLEGFIEMPVYLGPNHPTSCRVQINDFSTEPIVDKERDLKAA